MAQSWRTARVFISSTFRDMHAERDHLVRVVFPELKERCRQRYVHLIDVDLRWGVTQEEAEGGGALDICLDEIDSCRPYFLGLLGHRYGSVPPDQDHSITAAEIYHGVLHNSLPRQLIDLRPFVRGVLEGRTLYREQVETLVRCYQWDPHKKKHLLQQDITPEDEKTLRSIFDQYSLYQQDRSFFFFRSESLTRKLVGSHTQDFWGTDDALKSKLEALKDEIRNAGLPVFEYEDLECFGQKVLETLWQRIDAEFPEKREEEERDWLEQETEFHELFMADRTRRFVGRKGILQTMHKFVEGDSEHGLMVITGEPGCGKSALMARFTEDVIQNHPDWLILPHFVGASPSSTSLRLTLRRFCTHLNRAMGSTEELPEDFRELVSLFPQLLERASEEHRILLIMDAVNQMERADNAHSMRCLPGELPQNVRVVVSTLAGGALDALKARHIQPGIQTVSGLKEDDIRQLAAGYLEEIRRKFPTEDITQVFYEKVKAGNPLYITVALEELRVFPHYEKLGKRVAELPDTVPELFGQVLDRVEGDFNRPLVQDFTSLIACGRQGMTAEELQTLLKGHAAAVDPASPPQKLPDMLLARLRRALSAYLFERSGIIDFFHNQMKEAVGQRYLAEESDRYGVHRNIARYLESRWKEPYLRSLDELPHQLTKGKDWDGLERVLCDLYFIEAKCVAGMTYDLVADYKLALQVPGYPRQISSRVDDFSLFVSYEAQFLQRFPSSTYQQAYNWHTGSHVRKTAELLQEKGFSPAVAWLRKKARVVRHRHSGEVTSLAFWGGDRYMVASSTTREVWVWDVERSELSRRCSIPPSFVRCLAVSPDGELLAGGFGASDPDPFEAGVAIWKPDGEIYCSVRTIDWVWGLNWTEDLGLIASGGMPSGAEAGGNAWLVDVVAETYSPIPNLNADRPILFTWTLSRPPNPPIVVALSRDGRIHYGTPDGSNLGLSHANLELPKQPKAAVCARHASLWLIYGDGLFRLDLAVPPRESSVLRQLLGGAVVRGPSCLDVHPAGQLLVVGTAHGEVWILHVEGDVKPQLVHEGNSPITAVRFSNSGERIGVGDSSGNVCSYLWSTKKRIFCTEDVELAVAARIQDSRTIILYDARVDLFQSNNQESKESIALSESLNSLDFDAYGDLAVILSYPTDDVTRRHERCIQVVDLAKHRVLLCVNVPSGLGALNEAKTMTPYKFPFSRIRLEPGNDACRVLLGCEKGIMVYLFLAFSSGTPMVIPCPPVSSGPHAGEPSICCRCYEISLDHKSVVVGYRTWGSDIYYLGRGAEFRRWDIIGNVCSHAPTRLTSPICSIASTPLGVVILGTEDGDASSWRFDREWLRLGLVQHGARVAAIGCSRSAPIVSTASRDGIILVWDTRTGAVLLETFLDIEPVAIHIGNEDQNLSMVDGTGEIHQWVIENGHLLHATGGSALGTALEPSDDMAPERVHIRDHLTAAESIAAVQLRVEKGDCAGARRVLNALSSTGCMLAVKKDWMSRIAMAEKKRHLSKAIKEVTEELRKRAWNWPFSDGDYRLQEYLSQVKSEVARLAEEGRIEEARALTDLLPDTPDRVLESKMKLLKEIDGIVAIKEVTE